MTQEEQPEEVEEIVVEEQKVTREDVIEAVERIAKDDVDGLVQPAAVVEAARDPESPLHDYFEWDDTAAAERYRLVQARHLLARIRVVVTETQPLMVNVRLSTADGGQRRGYVTMQRAAADPSLYEQIATEARAGIASYRNRLSAFEQARAAVAQLDVALASLSTPD